MWCWCEVFVILDVFVQVAFARESIKFLGPEIGALIIYDHAVSSCQFTTEYTLSFVLYIWKCW